MIATAAVSEDNRPMPERLRLADIIGGLSVVSDLGYGLPPEEAMRSCLIATGLARAMGLSDQDALVTFYTALLFHVGCSTFSHELSQIHGDEIAANSIAATTDFSDPRDIITRFIPDSTRGMPAAARVRAAALIVTKFMSHPRERTSESTPSTCHRRATTNG
jgi:hypothetical protein